MTSKRSYRDPLPQATVRQILIEEMGAQFDPQFAAQMIHIIDEDQEYEMREKEDVKEFSGNDEFHFEASNAFHTEGILIFPSTKMNIHLRIAPLEGHNEDECRPEMVLFDSLDGRVHETGKLREELLYSRYASLHLDGTYSLDDARDIRTTVTSSGEQDHVCGEYDIEASRVKDHILIKINSSNGSVEYIIALMDSTRFSYISF